MISSIKSVTKARALIVKIPFPIFYSLLWLYGVSKNPAFTTEQLISLHNNDQFDIFDWPRTFGGSSRNSKKG